jgi:hypothetical protein
VIGTNRWRTEPPCVRKGAPHDQTESGGIVLAVNARARAPRGGVTRQGVVLTDLQSLLDCQQIFSLSPPPPPGESLVGMDTLGGRINGQCTTTKSQA